MATGARLVGLLFVLLISGCAAARPGTADHAVSEPGRAEAGAPIATEVTADQPRVAAWREDLDVLLARIRRIHPHPFERLAQDQVSAETRALMAAIPEMSDDEIVLAMMELMARMVGGHTQLYGASARTIEPRWFPIRFHVFSDGVGITAVSAAHADLAGARVLRIGDMDAERAVESVMRITPADNDVGRLHRAPYFMMADWVLAGLGITPERGILRLVVDGPDGRPRREVTLTALEEAPDDDLSFRATESVVGGSVVLARPSEPGRLPLHLRSRDERFWLAYLPDQRVLYVQIRYVGNGADETLEEFAERLWALADTVAVDRLVFDMRYARGGNKNLARPMLHGLLARPHLNQPGRLFTLIGRETFSAGMMVAIFLEEHSRTLFIGEPTGASPNFASETRGISLPHSGLVASVAEWYWVNSVPWDKRAALEPDVAAPFSIADWRSGRDPALDPILRYDMDYEAIADSVLPLRRQGLNRVKLAHAAMMEDLARGEPLTELELRDIGRALIGSADYEMGLELLSAWVVRFPTSTAARLARAEAYLRAGDPVRARADLLRVLELDPEHDRARALLGSLSAG